MASINEVRAQVLAAKQKAEESLGPDNQAHGLMEDVQGILARPMEGSGQVDVTVALGLAAQTLNDIEQVRMQTSALVSECESICNRL